MPNQSAGFHRVNYVNNFPKILSMLRRGKSSMPTAIRKYAAETAKIAKRSMKKAPKGVKNKKRFGTYRRWSRNSKKFRNAASPLQTYYFSKGLYSPPGSPPFWHPTGPNPSRRGKASLKNIKYVKLGSKLRYRVGPEFFPQRRKPPVPALHEHGGTVSVRTKSYYDRSGKLIKRPNAFIAKYPPRPYMAPALRISKPKFLNDINNLAGMKASKPAK